jgi:hypothetical protein
MQHSTTATTASQYAVCHAVVGVYTVCVATVCGSIRLTRRCVLIACTDYVVASADIKLLLILLSNRSWLVILTVLHFVHCCLV